MRGRSCTIGARLVAGVLACMGAAVAVHGQDPVRDELRRLDAVLLESAIIRGDSSLLAATALPHLRVVPPGGIVEDRDEALRGVAAFAVDSIALSHTEVLTQGSTAVVIARLELFGEVRGVGRLGPLRVMSVFTKVDGDWRLLARSVTPCVPQAIAAGRC